MKSPPLNETSYMLLPESITFCLWVSATREISQSPRLFLILIRLATDLFIMFGFLPHTLYVGLKKYIKISSKYYVRTSRCKSVILSKRLQGVHRVISCSHSLLALYRLISQKSLSLTFTSKIRILPNLSWFLFETSTLLLPMKPTATPLELLWPCGKKGFPLKSSFYFFHHA